MPKTQKLLFAFSGGELSPLLDCRIDQQKYQAGCRTLENMIPLIQGGATRRPGTEYITGAISNDNPSRLVAFEYSVSTKYILEFGNQVIRVYKDGSQIYSGGVVYEITTPYLQADLFELKFEHSADVMYITHESYEPRMLARTGDASWTLTCITHKKGPFLTQNTDEDITITPSDTTGSITLTASEDLFDDNMAPAGSGATDASNNGALFKFMMLAPENAVSNSETTEFTGTDLTVFVGNKIDFITQGSWSGRVLVEKSYDNGSNYTTIWTAYSEYNGNDKVAFDEEQADALYRVRCDSYTGGTIVARLSRRSMLIDRYVQITAVASATSATATVLDYGSGSHAGLVFTDATWRWSEGAWSDYRGWPSTVGITRDERLAFAGSTSKPLTIWCSKIGDFTCFLTGDTDDAAVTYTLSGSGQQNIIHWMLQKRNMLLGTAGGIHKFRTNDDSGKMAPEAEGQTSKGSANIQAIGVDEAVLFVERGGRKVREILYDFASETFKAEDLSVFSEHITDSGIVDMAFQKSPDPMLWMVLDNGYIVIMSYDKAQQVNSWAKIITEDSSD